MFKQLCQQGSKQICRKQAKRETWPCLELGTVLLPRRHQRLLPGAPDDSFVNLPLQFQAREICPEGASSRSAGGGFLVIPAALQTRGTFMRLDQPWERTTGEEATPWLLEPLALAFVGYACGGIWLPGKVLE